MSAEIDITVVTDLIRAVPVPVTAVDVTPIQGPCTLFGWSLREAAGEIPASAEGSVTSPAALATIATTASLPAGTNNVNWTVELAGTLAAVDANNFQLVDSAGVVVASVNPAVAGNYIQPAAQIVTTVAGAILVRANALATVGAIYSAAIEVVPAGGASAVVELQDGNQPLAEIGIPPLEFDTESMPGSGVHVGQQIKVHVIQGAVVGVLYVRFDKQS